MFNTLESAWDRSARRGWTTLASFGFEAMAVSLLLLVPLVWVQGPPKLTWFDPSRVLVPPPAPGPPHIGQRHAGPSSSNLNGMHLIPPSIIPSTIAQLHEELVPSAPDFNEIGVSGGTGPGSRPGVYNSIGDGNIAPLPPAPATTRPLMVSHWAEGNVIYRVQPLYPPLARQARIQGTVQLRAIISKGGVIENLVAVSGHPMLISSALAAVRQWRYRPYMLNGEPIEVETEITVNFVLAAN